MAMVLHGPLAKTSDNKIKTFMIFNFQHVRVMYKKNSDFKKNSEATTGDMTFYGLICFKKSVCVNTVL